MYITKSLVMRLRNQVFSSHEIINFLPVGDRRSPSFWGLNKQKSTSLICSHFMRVIILGHAFQLLCGNQDHAYNPVMQGMYGCSSIYFYNWMFFFTPMN